MISTPVRAFSKLSQKLVTPSSFRQACPLFRLKLNFVIDMLLETTLSQPDFSGLDLLPGDSLVDSGYSSVLSVKELTKCRVYRPPKATLQAWLGCDSSLPNVKCYFKIGLHHPLIYLQGVKQLNTSTTSLIWKSHPLSDAISAQIQKARITYSNLPQIGCRGDVSQSTKRRVY